MLPKKIISKTGFEVSALGFGCMGISEFYGNTNLSDAKNSLLRAVELGVTHFDTADVYGFGHNEEFLNNVLNPYKNKISIASKFGIIRDKNDPSKRGVNNSKQYIKLACEQSLKRLGLETIDLYYMHRYDGISKVEDIILAMAELVKEGKIKYIGLSEVDANFIQQANSIHPITAVQVEYSLWTSFTEQEIIPLCKQLGIGFVAYSPVGRGFLTGNLKNTNNLSEKDYRRTLPRFQGENFKHNLQLVAEVEKLAITKSSTPAQIALAYVLQAGDNVTAIPGTRQIKHLEENIASVNVNLTAVEIVNLKQIINSIAVSGERYTKSSMQMYNFKQ